MAIITKVEQQKNNQHRFSIYLDDKYSFSVSEDTLVKTRLRKGMEVDRVEIEKILQEEDFNLCKNYGLKLLGYKSRSEYEIKEKMINKGFSKDSIEKSLQYFREENYINDREYAERYIKDRINLKKLGYHRIKNELYKRNIDSSIVEELLNEYISFSDEYERALELAIKKAKTTYRSQDVQALYRKLGGYLQRQGYSMDIITKVLREVLKSLKK